MISQVSQSIKPRAKPVVRIWEEFPMAARPLGLEMENRSVTYIHHMKGSSPHRKNKIQFVPCAIDNSDPQDLALYVSHMPSPRGSSKPSHVSPTAPPHSARNPFTSKKGSSFDVCHWDFRWKSKVRRHRAFNGSRVEFETVFLSRPLLGSFSSC